MTLCIRIRRPWLDVDNSPDYVCLSEQFEVARPTLPVYYSVQSSPSSTSSTGGARARGFDCLFVVLLVLLCTGFGRSRGLVFGTSLRSGIGDWRCAAARRAAFSTAGLVCVR